MILENFYLVNFNEGLAGEPPDFLQPLISGVVKSHRLWWVGHAARAPPTLYVRQVLNERPTSPWAQGRPPLRWEDCVSKDAGFLEIPDWRKTCQNRVAWRKTCDAAVELQAL